MTCGIYCITDTETGDRYVGRSINIERRVSAHGVNGRETLVYSILQICLESELYEAEWDWVFNLKPELNRTVPAMHTSKGKVWHNPGVVRATLRRKRNGCKSSYLMNVLLKAEISRTGVEDYRNETQQLHYLVRLGLRYRAQMLKTPVDVPVNGVEEAVND